MFWRLLVGGRAAGRWKKRFAGVIRGSMVMASIHSSKSFGAVDVGRALFRAAPVVGGLIRQPTQTRGYNGWGNLRHLLHQPTTYKNRWYRSCIDVVSPSSLSPAQGEAVHSAGHLVTIYTSNILPRTPSYPLVAATISDHHAIAAAGGQPITVAQQGGDAASRFFAFVAGLKFIVQQCLFRTYQGYGLGGLRQ